MHHDITGTQNPIGPHMLTSPKRSLDTFNYGTSIRITLWNQSGNPIDSITITPDDARQLAGDLETLADIIESEKE